MVRILTGCPLTGDYVQPVDKSVDYVEWVNNFENGEEGPHTYEWDIGIAP